MGQEVLALVFTAVAGYLLGSINWSIILTWFFKNKEDIREYGSGGRQRSGSCGERVLQRRLIYF